MKVLQLHTNYVEYAPVKKEISYAEEAAGNQVRIDECAVLFSCIEEGDDPAVVERAAIDTKNSITKIAVKRVLIYPYAHLSQTLAPPKEALELIMLLEKLLRGMDVEVYRAPFGWTKSLNLSVKGHPLAEQSRSYSPITQHSDNVRHANVRRQVSEKELLSRIRKSDFSGLPDYDHRILGETLDLFSFHEPSPGMVYWHDKGLKLRQILIDFIRGELSRYGYVEISTPALANTVLWKVSGHWDNYRDNMFITYLGNEEFGLKPMNCPSTFLFYKARRWSYRDLPLKVADFDALFRNELSGVASGLFRIKILTQDDAHIFASESDVQPVINEILNMLKKMYAIFGLEFTVKIATMPDKHIGTPDQWGAAEKVLFDACASAGITPEVKEKEGAFYGPKIDVDVKDAMGRSWQLGTIQLDYQMPQRFELKYEGPDGKDHVPVVIHRVIYGSLERFIGILLEHYRGRLPVWLSPVQVKIITVSGDFRDYANSVLSSLKAAGIRAEADFRETTVGSKIKVAQLAKIPFMLVIGAREASTKTLSVRTREGKTEEGVGLDKFVRDVETLVGSFK